jgi:hypothetical protein
MSDDPREIVAAEHGLDERAARFLSGETVEEMEASAAALAELIGRRVRGGRAAPAADPISTALASKSSRKAERHALFTGRAPQRRDEQGRFTSSGGFDGGARKPVAPPRNPEREHGELLGQMAALSRTFGSGRW